MIKYSIIIPTLNQSRKLNLCLEHLSKLHFDQDMFEVLVIDNGSTDDTKSVSFSYKDRIRNLYYHYCEEPGLMVARHMGCDEAKGDILYYLDDDSLVTKDWLQGIEESFGYESVVLAGGPCIPRYESDQPTWISYFWEKADYGKYKPFLSLVIANCYTPWLARREPLAGFPKGRSIPLVEGGVNAPPENASVQGDRRVPCREFTYGCNFAIKKRTFFALGGTCPDYYPEEYRQYIGDGETSLAIKILNSGFKALYNPKAKIEHLIPASRLTVEYFCWRRTYNGTRVSENL